VLLAPRRGLSAYSAMEITHYVLVIDFETFELSKGKNKHVNRELVTIALTLIISQLQSVPILLREA